MQGVVRKAIIEILAKGVEKELISPTIYSLDCNAMCPIKL